MFSGSVDRGDCPEVRRHGGCGCGEQRDEQFRCIEAALVGGAQHTGEHLLTVRTTARAIAAAAHFARDDGRAQRVLGAPVGGVERRVEEKAEDGVVFDDEVLLKPSHGEPATRRALQKLRPAAQVLPARDCQTVRGDHARVIAIAGWQRGLQGRFHGRDEGLLRIVEQQDTTPRSRCARQVWCAACVNWRYDCQPSRCSTPG